MYEFKRGLDQLSLSNDDGVRNDMILVKAIDPPDEGYRDPFVLLSDGAIELWVFADEFKNKIGDEYTSYIMSLQEEDAVLQITEKYAAYKKGPYLYSYDLYGKITSNWLLAVGDFEIDVTEDALRDFEVGDFVHVQVDRLDGIICND